MRAALILPVIFVLGAVVVSSVFIVDERKQALVLQFGQVKQEVRTSSNLCVVGLIITVQLDIGQLEISR